jgi:hypothetical protein
MLFFGIAAESYFLPALLKSDCIASSIAMAPPFFGPVTLIKSGREISGNRPMPAEKTEKAEKRPGKASGDRRGLGKIPFLNPPNLAKKQACARAVRD